MNKLPCLLFLMTISISSYAEDNPAFLNAWFFPMYNTPITFNKLHPLIEGFQEETGAILNLVISSDLDALEDACRTKTFDIVLIPIYAGVDLESRCNLQKVAKAISSSHIYARGSTSLGDINVLGIVRHTGEEKSVEAAWEGEKTPSIVYFENGSNAILGLADKKVDAIYMLDSIVDISSETITKNFKIIDGTAGPNGAVFYLNKNLDKRYRDSIVSILGAGRSIAGVFDFKKIEQ